MSLRSNLAKLVPDPFKQNGINKGNHNGDDWSTVNQLIRDMCKINYSKDKAEFFYDGKCVGWAKSDGKAWIDEKAYNKIKADWDALSEEEKNKIRGIYDTSDDAEEDLEGEDEYGYDEDEEECEWTPNADGLIDYYYTISTDFNPDDYTRFGIKPVAAISITAKEYWDNEGYLYGDEEEIEHILTEFNAEPENSQGFCYAGFDEAKMVEGMKQYGYNMIRNDDLPTI